MLTSNWSLPNAGSCLIQFFSIAEYCNFVSINNVWTQTVKDSAVWRLECQTHIPGNYSQVSYEPLVGYCKQDTFLFSYFLDIKKQKGHEIISTPFEKILKSLTAGFQINLNKEELGTDSLPGLHWTL